MAFRPRGPRFAALALGALALGVLVSAPAWGSDSGADGERTRAMTAPQAPED